MEEQVIFKPVDADTIPTVDVSDIDHLVAQSQVQTEQIKKIIYPLKDLHESLMVSENDTYKSH